MKNPYLKLKSIRIFLLIGTLAVLSSFGALVFDFTRLNVESNHSTIQFYVPISNGITRMSGKFTDYSMDIAYDSINFTNSKILVNIKAESINTGIDGRDEHLRTADFFDTEAFPEITFLSTSIVENEEGSYLVDGDFTMRGITKNIQLPLTITGKDGKYTVGFSSRLVLNRMDYNIGSDFKHTSMDNFIGEEITIEIDFWTKKWKAPKTK